MRKRFSQIQIFRGDPIQQAMIGHGLSATSNSGLVNRLFERGFIISERLKNAMLKVDRAQYVKGMASPYANDCYKIGKHAVSTPQFHAQQLSLVDEGLGQGKHAIDVGTGTGYLAAVMAEMGCESVTATEVSHEMFDLASENLSKYSNVTVKLSKPSDVLFETGKFYDAITVAPAIRSVNDITSLSVGGVAAISIQTDRMFSSFTFVRKNDCGVLEEERLMDVACEKIIENEAIDSEGSLQLIEKWKKQFLTKQGRLPTKHDLLNDPEAYENFKLYTKSTKYIPRL